MAGMKERRITAQEAAAILRVSTKTMYRLLQEGSVKGYQLGGPGGGEWRTWESAVEEWEDRQLTLETTGAVDYRISACARDYMTMQRTGLLSGIQDGEEMDMRDEARACLGAALEALEDGNSGGALNSAARAVAAIEVWGRQ